MTRKSHTLILISALALSACAQLPVSPNGASDRASAININDTQRGVAVTIAEGILFETGKHNLQADSEPVLERLAELIRQTDKPIAVEGHTDNIGDKSSNLRLSQRRANTVVRALKAHGVDAYRLHAEGYGMTQPVADNSTPSGRQYNRRVEVYILGERKRNLKFRGAVAGGGSASSHFDGAFSMRVQELSNQFKNLPGIRWMF